jgi:predicted nucleic acid-binding protein
LKLYLDSSALVKLVQRESESDALRGFITDHTSDTLVTSALARVEVVRAVWSGGHRAIDHAHRQLARLDQIVLGSALLDRAAGLMPEAQLRIPDAIHLAAAQTAGDDLRAIVTYDRRMANAAGALGLVVQTPL